MMLHTEQRLLLSNQDIPYNPPAHQAFPLETRITPTTSHDITGSHMTSQDVTWHHRKSHDITWHHMTSQDVTWHGLRTHHITIEMLLSYYHNYYNHHSLALVGCLCGPPIRCLAVCRGPAHRPSIHSECLFGSAVQSDVGELSNGAAQTRPTRL